VEDVLDDLEFASHFLMEVRRRAAGDELCKDIKGLKSPSQSFERITADSASTNVSMEETIPSPPDPH
jgi:hypothetical protein